MSMVIRWSGGVAVLLVATGAVAQPNLITNGGFESPGFPLNPNYRYLSGGNATLLTAWRCVYDGHQEASYVFHSSRYETIEGAYTIALNDGDRLETEVTLTGGANYRFSFLAGGSGLNALELAGGGAALSFRSGDGVDVGHRGSRGGRYLWFAKPFQAGASGPVILSVRNPFDAGNCFACGQWIIDRVTLECVWVDPIPAAVSACAGAPVVVRARTQADAPSFRWQMRVLGSWEDLADGPRPWGSVLSGTSGEELRIDNTAPADDGEYRCVVSNACGAAASNGTIITVVDCAPDCDCNTVLDVFDFLCFQNRFALSDPYACDCDTGSGPGVCDIFDFLCFQNAFDAGCP